MAVINKNIDHGRAFDWGRTSKEYAKYRDIYPKDFYDRIIARKLCVNGQKVLDLGTGTGVLPRNMYAFGAEWIGVDLEENQITEAKRLSNESGMDITYFALPVEEMDFPGNTFDVITACQCFWYFNPAIIAPKLATLLKKDGRLLLLYMAWLPYEDKVAGLSEELVLKYNPAWSGAGETRRPIAIPDDIFDYFELAAHEEYDLMVPFTRETWHGRMKSCRGVGASLSGEELLQWEAEHIEMLEKKASEEFNVLHYAAMAELKLK